MFMVMYTGIVVKESSHFVVLMHALKMQQKVV